MTVPMRVQFNVPKPTGVEDVHLALEWPRGRIDFHAITG